MAQTTSGTTASPAPVTDPVTEAQKNALVPVITIPPGSDVINLSKNNPKSQTLPPEGSLIGDITGGTVRADGSGGTYFVPDGSGSGGGSGGSGGGNAPGGSTLIPIGSAPGGGFLLLNPVTGEKTIGYPGIGYPGGTGPGDTTIYYPNPGGSGGGGSVGFTPGVPTPNFPGTQQSDLAAIQKQNQIDLAVKQLSENQRKTEMLKTQFSYIENEPMHAFVKPGEIIGYATDPITGQRVPAYAPVYVDPGFYDEEGNLIIGKLKRTERLATIEESKGLFKKPISLEAGTASLKQQTLKQKAANLVNVQELYTRFNTFNSPTGEILSNAQREKLSSFENKVLPIATSILFPYLAMPGFDKTTKEFVLGFEKQIINDLIENPGKNVLLFGAGAGLGFAFKGVSAGLSAIPKFGAEISQIFKLGAVGYGGYQTSKAVWSTILSAVPELTDISQTKSAEERGAILGESTKDLALIGLGFGVGEKGFNIARGEIVARLRGSETIDVKQGVYPQAEVNKQLKLFQENIYKEISENPIMFHTTSQIKSVAEQGTIKPKVGESELPGLYGSTQVSTSFSRLPGSGAEVPTGLDAFIKSIKQMLGPEQNPGVASLEPLRFRESEIKYANKPTFEGQKNIGTKTNPKYAYFKSPAEPGAIDVPGIKSEIEGLARTDAGNYKEIETATKKLYDVKIKGVRVPLENFRIDESSIKDTINKLRDNLQKDIKEQIVESSIGKAIKELQRESIGKETSAAKVDNVDVIRFEESNKQIRDQFKQDVSAAQKAVIRIQAEHEVNLYEISHGKLNTKIRDAFIEAREKKIIEEYVKDLNKQPQNKANALFENINKEIQKEFNPNQYSISSITYGPEIAILSGIINSSTSSMSENPSSNISSEVSNTLKSISSSVMSSAQSMSSQASSLQSSSPYSTSESSSAKSTSVSKSAQGSSSASDVSDYYLTLTKEINKNYDEPKAIKSKQKFLGTGYDVFIKVVKTSKFAKINKSPVTKDRAKDIQAYALDNSLARTSKIQKSNSPAIEDLEFLYIPEGYYNARKYTLRQFKVKQGEKYAFGEQEIKLGKYLQDTEAEKRQLQAFRKEAERLSR